MIPIWVFIVNFSKIITASSLPMFNLCSQCGNLSIRKSTSISAESISANWQGLIFFFQNQFRNPFCTGFNFLFWFCAKNIHSKIQSFCCTRIPVEEWVEGKITKIEAICGTRWSICASYNFFFYWIQFLVSLSWWFYWTI